MSDELKVSSKLKDQGEREQGAGFGAGEGAVYG